VFFFWILIYIEKEEKMKISCNRVSRVFLVTSWFRIFVNQFVDGFWWDFWGVFSRDFCLPFGYGFFWGFWTLGVFGVFGIYMVT